MTDQAVHPAGGNTVESVLRDELAQGDAVADTFLPVLRHLVSADDSSLFSEEILARLRAMVSDLSSALLEALVDGGETDSVASAALLGELDVLSRALLDEPALLRHLHALALEWQLTERLQARLALDPVVSPLVQQLIASADADTQRDAMAFLAAQARWCQTQRRMQVALGELPGPLVQGVIALLRRLVGEGTALQARVDRIEGNLDAGRRERESRLELGARLLQRMGSGSGEALSLTHAGTALFLTALALGSALDRDMVIFSTHETQIARLALALRAAGARPSMVEEQFLVLHPQITLPPGFERLDSTLAAQMLVAGTV